MTEAKRFLKPAILLLGLAPLFTGCASQLVTQTHLEQRTEAALGLDASTYKISDRADDGPTTRYKVVTRDGRKFSCTIGTAVSVLGAMVTDAVCYPAAGQRSAAKSPTSPACNELLRAAGKC